MSRHAVRGWLYYVLLTGVVLGFTMYYLRGWFLHHPSCITAGGGCTLWRLLGQEDTNPWRSIAAKVPPTADLTPISTNLTPISTNLTPISTNVTPIQVPLHGSFIY